MNTKSSRGGILAFVILLACAGAILPLPPFGGASAGAQAHTAQAAFDRLKALAGTWQGTDGHEGEETVTHVFEVSAAGTVVMETMNPDSPDHEMINMYHLDGDELVLTHYCASGNQPTMQLVRPAAAANEMRFDFTGGSNLDPAKDQHIHAARLVIVDAETLESSWTGYNEGKEAGVKTFVLERGE